MRWISVSHEIIKHDCDTRDTRTHEWACWVSEIESVGTRAWKSAVPASRAIAKLGGEEALNALIERFQIADETLDHLPRLHYMGERERGLPWNWKTACKSITSAGETRLATHIH